MIKNNSLTMHSPKARHLSALRSREGCTDHEALRAISNITLPDLTITFSAVLPVKAYGLLERMSEDIDLRLDIGERAALSRSLLRRSLSTVKAHCRGTSGRPIHSARCGNPRAQRESIRFTQSTLYLAISTRCRAPAGSARRIYGNFAATRNAISLTSTVDR